MLSLEKAVVQMRHPDVRRVVSRGRLVSEVINVFLVYAFRRIIENSR